MIYIIAFITVKHSEMGKSEMDMEVTLFEIHSETTLAK